jgi:hypothetical protein
MTFTFTASQPRKFHQFMVLRRWRTPTDKRRVALTAFRTPGLFGPGSVGDGRKITVELKTLADPAADRTLIGKFDAATNACINELRRLNDLLSAGTLSEEDAETQASLFFNRFVEGIMPACVISAVQDPFREEGVPWSATSRTTAPASDPTALFTLT